MRMIEIRELRELDLSAHHHHLTLVLSIDNTSMLLLHVSQYCTLGFLGEISFTPLVYHPGGCLGCPEADKLKEL